MSRAVSKKKPTVDGHDYSYANDTLDYGLNWPPFADFTLDPQFASASFASATAAVEPLAATAGEPGPTAGPAPYVPSDGMVGQQWHLNAINVGGIWPDYTGRGVHVGVYDSAVDRNHADLNDNYDASRHIVINGATVVPNPGMINADNHGTAVAGIIAAENNGVGTVGVAFGSTITSVPVFGSGWVDNVAAMNWQTNFDVVNHSWGWFTPFWDNPQHLTAGEATFFQNFSAGIENAADNGRGGLGTVMVTAAGNERRPGTDWGQTDWGVNWTMTSWWESNDTNAHAFQNDRHMVTVAGVGQNGLVAEYSTPGASVLVAAPTLSRFADGVDAGQPGTTPASTDWIQTTDRAGAAGYNTAANTTANPTAGDYTGFNGTSAATPIVTGVVALMLEANPLLGWRDVREILANSAVHTGSPVGGALTGSELDAWQFNHATHWNGGGMHFSNDYGFGRVDAHAAVRLAETWTTMKTSANEVSAAGNWTGNLVLADGGAASTFNITLPTGVRTETIELHVDLQHAEPGELRVELVNARGTASLLLQPVGGERLPGINGWTFTSNEFLGELTDGGNWTVRVTDTQNDETGATDGVITGARLTAFGSAPTNDNVYIYTDNFADVAIDGVHGFRGFDLNGGTDTINAAAITSDTIINLEDGHYRIDGVENWFGGAGSGDPSFYMIENIFGGDGDDELAGNSQANHIKGGYGNDVLGGRGGNDIIEGDRGVDALYGDAGDDRLGVGYDYNPFAVDYIDGGEGVDMADFSESAMAVWVSLGYAGREVWTRDRADVDSGTWREFADLVSIENVLGSQGSDFIEGDAGRNFLSGSGGNDTLFGLDGNDELSPGLGVDTVYGGRSDDVISVSRESNPFGFDVLYGGEDSDTLSFVVNFRYYGVTVDLSSGVYGTTRFYEMENVNGTRFADAITGDASANVLDGRSGNDTLRGGLGSDTLNGGEGVDSAVFTGARSAYVLTNLGGGNVRVAGLDGTDTASAVEKLVFGNATLNWSLTAGNDFNGDAFGDILWRNTKTGGVATWELNGAGGVAADSYGGAGLAWKQIAADDFNADGKGDILWRNTSTGQVGVWELNGSGGFTFEGYGGAGLAWNSVGSGDFNADGFADILYRNTSTGQVATWEFNGAGGFAFDGYGSESLAWKIVGSGDFNGDGKDDILWRDSGNGQVKTWELDGSGGFVSDSYGGAGLAWHVFGVGDFNADGRDDILWRNDTTGVVATWELNGAGGFGFDNYGSAGLQWAIMDATDTSSDGKDDILWRNTTTGQVATWELNGAGGIAFDGYGTNSLDWQVFTGNFDFV